MPLPVHKSGRTSTFARFSIVYETETIGETNDIEPHHVVIMTNREIPKANLMVAAMLLDQGIHHSQLKEMLPGAEAYVKVVE